MGSRVLYAFRRNLVVAASAGTGKTHSLVGVLVHLLLGASEMGGGGLREAVEPARVVATTFSRKAAAEIRTRLVEELERLATEGAPSKYAADLDLARAARGLPAWDARDRAKRAKAALAGIARAQIGTLHGFAGTIARRFALELGLSPGFDLADEGESLARTRAVIERVVGGHVDGARDRDVRALARAAGGVDRLVSQLERALARLEEEGRGAEELAIAEGDEAALEARMESLVMHASAAATDPKIGAEARALVDAWRARQGDDASAARIADAAAELFGLARSRSKGEAAIALFDLRDAMARSGDDNAEVARKLVAAWRMRARFRPHAEAARALLAECEAEAHRASRRDAVLGFGEVLRAARDVLRDHPRAAAELGKELDVLLVDEFQDTSRLQRDLVALLWEDDPLARAPGALATFARVRPHGLFVVGDRKQSIYGFRGADVSVFAEVCVALAGAPAREALGIPRGVAWEPEAPSADFVPLRHNRRSIAPILGFANAFSARRFRPAELPPALYEIAYAPAIEDLLPPPEAPPASTRVPATAWLRVPAPRGSSTRLDEAFAIAARVRQLVAAADAPPRFRDMAVLAQTNKMLDACAFAFAQADVPFVVAGSGFWSAREVRDLLALLACVVRPEDTLARLEVLRGPWAGVRDETLVALTSPYKGLSSVEDWGEGERRALLHEEDREPVARLRDLVLELRRASARLGPAALLGEAVRALAIEEVLVQLPRGAQRVANVRKLVAMAEGASSPRAFLDEARAAADREANETEAATFSEEDDAVRLLTVHASKGLDFPIVFLPEVGSANVFPPPGAIVLLPGVGHAKTRLAVRLADEGASADGAPEGDGRKLDPPSFVDAIEELKRRDQAERARLAYVAVTRAARAIVFVGDRKRPKSGDGATYARTTAATLADIAEAVPAALAVEDAPPPGALEPIVGAAAFEDAPEEAPPPLAPAWRALPIATTSLQDFAHCPRRFQLLHVLDMPERGAAAVGAVRAPASDESPPAFDARLEGTLAHRVLERVDPSCFGGGPRAAAAMTALLEREGAPREHPVHASVVAKVGRFLAGPYASRVRAEGATLLREHPFVLSIPDADGRTLALRGTIDLLVAWPDGAVDVLDYKRARGASPTPYAFQLEVYALAARALHPDAPAVRAGIVFLGGNAPEPAWHPLADPRKVRARMAALAASLVEARWRDVFPRVNVDRCHALRCGFVELCHEAEGG